MQMDSSSFRTDSQLAGNPFGGRSDRVSQKRQHPHLDLGAIAMVKGMAFDSTDTGVNFLFRQIQFAGRIRTLRGEGTFFGLMRRSRGIVASLPFHALGGFSSL